MSGVLFAKVIFLGSVSSPKAKTAEVTALAQIWAQGSLTIPPF
jgi:hypothetical protein